MGRIHIAEPSGVRAEYDESQVRSMWQQGLLDRAAVYWRPGMADWRPMSELFQPQTFAPPAYASQQAPWSGFAYIRNPRTLTNTVVVMLCVFLAFVVISILSDIAQWVLLDGPLTLSAANANDTRQGVIGLGYLAVYIATAVFFLMWKYRASLNCRGFGAQGMAFTPGWCVGWYFIPFMNLVRPFQAMREIWRVSHDPVSWQIRGGSVLLGFWWALWLINGFMGQIVFRLSMAAETIDELKASTLASILSGCIEIPLCFVALALVKTIARRQEELVTRGLPQPSAPSY